MKLKSRASIAGHPIHPMLVVFPVGLLIFSFISDLIYLAGHNLTWSDVAYYTMAGGIVGALVAAIPGAIDLFSLPSSRARTIGFIHMAINLTVVVLFAINFWIRSSTDSVSAGPVWLSAIGIALLAVSGWLGGEMVYAHGVGVGSTETDSDEVRLHASTSRR